MVATAENQSQLRDKQVQQAEELLFSGPQRRSFAKELFFGRCAADGIMPYPCLAAQQVNQVDAALAELRTVCDRYLDADQIDRQATIPTALIAHLGKAGVLGMTAPASVGGKGFTQLAYCRLLEELGSRCSATSIFVNAHHSIGMRGLLLFGTEQQQQKWLPALVRGDAIAAFALTEVQAGSDAANVQTTATPTEDGSHFVLNGTKRYITNGAIADLLTVMARTPVSGSGSGKDGDETAVTAFLVTPDMPGFRVVEPRMEKLGIRGTATAKLAFENMLVPRENILGTMGKGLRVALTVLDFGRTTFGACCTGAAKTCLRLALDHARHRVQFGQPLASFQLVQDKLAHMAADIYAMEAMTNVTAGMIDRGSDDYMLETAMLKVWSTEKLWRIVNDAFQIHGGAAYFTDRPLERMLRDARINQIGEGANEVLISFIGLVGMRGPGECLRVIAEHAKKPWQHPGDLSRFVWTEISRRFTRPHLEVQCPHLRRAASRWSRRVRQLGLYVERQLMHHREAILDHQRVQQRIAWAAMELYASASVISRADSQWAKTAQAPDSVVMLSLTHSDRCVERMLHRRSGQDDHRWQSAFDELIRRGDKWDST